MTTADVLVVGGGVVGLTVALELRRRSPSARIVVLEKEDAPGRHASGRNSGVLHAGFYYTPDSLKARLTRDGNAEMRAYCEARGLSVHACGKLVVARDVTEHARLDELFVRAEKNGVVVRAVDEREARTIEPRVKTAGRALFSPTTATVDPRAVMTSLAEDVRRAGIDLRLGTPYRGVREVREGRECRDVRVRAGGEDISCGFVINAAGLQADRVAREFGWSRRHRVLPFKGLYLKSSEPVGAFRTNVYPVPRLDQPFLGVHVTVTADGHAKIGPTAIPCLWREQYGGLTGFDARDFGEVAAAGLRLWRTNDSGFRALALEEMKKLGRSRIVADAARLVDGVRAADYVHWGPPGIRAQLVDVERGALVHDFLLEGDARSLHVLNAVSPAFTCAFPFARLVCDRVDAAVRESG